MSALGEMSFNYQCQDDEKIEDEILRFLGALPAVILKLGAGICIASAGMIAPFVFSGIIEFCDGWDAIHD